ncbi:MAG: DUF2156 domain-containing protein [Kofleriaceae bacterium]|nr:DUF2156 domain-containing protein [Kofleriaceae bacterium]
MAEDAIRTRVLALLARHGWNSTSFQILEPGFRYWFDGDDACVGYVDTGSAWVAAGPPIAPSERLGDVVERFTAAAREHGRRVCCFGTETRFAETTRWPSLPIGEQPTWAPEEWADIKKASKSLREQLRRARAKGVVVDEVTPAELAAGHPTRTQLETLISRWLASRAIAPMGFLVQVDPFTFPEERRYFVARKDDKILGFLGIIPIYARGGWFFEDFLRDPDAPNGTVELLVDAGMRAAVESKIALVTLGLVPLSGDVSPWLRVARKAGRPLYDFDGLRTFKAKLKPRAWDPIFLAYPPGRSSVVAIVDTLTAFARGGLLRFGLETVLRGPAIVVRVLAVLLVLWTVMLALPVTTPWFPSSMWQWSWVGFDIALFVALFQLARRWDTRLATVVAAAVSADAVLTLGEAIIYNGPRIRGVPDVAVLVIAVLAPTLASIVLWNARARATTAARPP